MKSRKIEMWLLVFWNVPAFVLSYFYGNNYLITAIFFFVIPAIYVSARKPKVIKKTSLVSIILIIPLVSIINYLAHTDGAWYNFSVLGIRFLNTYPPDDFLWGFFYFYYIIAAYEYFFDRERILKTPKKILGFEVVFFSLALLFTIFIYFRKVPLVIEYSYAWILGICAFLIPGIIFIAHPRIFTKAVYMGFFFLPLSLLYEYVANIKENWVFPGNNFIGQVNVLNISFPFEEFVWLLVTVPAVIALYEFLADDEV